MSYKYYEFGDGDVLARKKNPLGHEFELWRGASHGWEPCENTDRFYETANGPLDADDVERLKDDFPGAFAGSGAGDKMHERLKAAMSKSN